MLMPVRQQRTPGNSSVAQLVSAAPSIAAADDATPISATVHTRWWRCERGRRSPYTG
jgi:hypothetical protein